MGRNLTTIRASERLFWASDLWGLGKPFRRPTRAAVRHRRKIAQMNLQSSEFIPLRWARPPEGRLRSTL